MQILQGLKERQRRTITRKLKSGEIEFNAAKKVFVYSEEGKGEFDLGVKEDEDFGEERKSEDSEGQSDGSDDWLKKLINKNNDFLEFRILEWVPRSDSCWYRCDWGLFMVLLSR